MLVQTLIFLVTTLGDLFVLALLMRFLLQWARAPARNQLSLFLAAVTDFVVRPARRVIPGWWGLDFATLVLAWIAAILEMWLVLTIKGYQLGSVPGIALAVLSALGALQLLRLVIYIVMGAVILQAVMSWIQTYNPMMSVVNNVTRPFLRPFQRVIPTVANVDLSPLFVLIIGQLILTVPLAWLESMVGRLL